MSTPIEKRRPRATWAARLQRVGLAVGLMLTTPAALMAAEPIDEEGTVTWTFNAGAESPTQAVSSVEGVMSSSTYELSSQLKFNGTWSSMTKLEPAEANIGGTLDANAYVAFRFTPKKGMTFAPTELSLDMAKIGTGGGKLTIDLISGNRNVRLLDGYNPVTQSTIENNAYTVEGFEATESTIEIRFYIYSLNLTKGFGMRNICLKGKWQGTPEEVPVYTLSTATSHEGAGSVVVSPAGSEFDADTELTLTATENLGYRFELWTDAEGNTVSTDNPYTFSIDANTALTARYTTYNVYGLSLALTQGALTHTW